MVRKIQKVALVALKNQPVSLPAGAKPFGVGYEGPELFLYYTAEREVPMITRQFVVLSAGDEMPDEELTFMGVAKLTSSMGEWVSFVFGRWNAKYG